MERIELYKNRIMNNTGISIQETKKPKESTKAQGIECTLLVFLSTSNSLILFISCFSFCQHPPPHNVPCCSQTPLKLNQDPPMVAKCNHLCFVALFLSSQCSYRRCFTRFWCWFISFSPLIHIPHGDPYLGHRHLCVHVIFPDLFFVRLNAWRDANLWHRYDAQTPPVSKRTWRGHEPSGSRCEGLSLIPSCDCLST